MAYDWIKALHVIAVIAWMAGLLYLPRLFVYHADAVHGSDKSETFKIMERRLLKAIMTPAMIVDLARRPLAGSGRAAGIKSRLASRQIRSWSSACQGCTVLRRYVKDSRLTGTIGRRGSTGSINEAPTVLMIVIVILVVVKPF